MINISLSEIYRVLQKINYYFDSKILNEKDIEEEILDADKIFLEDYQNLITESSKISRMMNTGDIDKAIKNFVKVIVYLSNLEANLSNARGNAENVTNWYLGNKNQIQKLIVNPPKLESTINKINAVKIQLSEIYSLLLRLNNHYNDDALDSTLLKERVNKIDETLSNECNKLMTEVNQIEQLLDSRDVDKALQHIVKIRLLLESIEAIIADAVREANKIILWH